jgi:hypothetical protein
MSWTTGTHEKTMIAAAIRTFSLITPPLSYMQERGDIKNRWIVRVRDTCCSVPWHSRMPLFCSEIPPCHKMNERRSSPPLLAIPVKAIIRFGISGITIKAAMQKNR